MDVISTGKGEWFSVGTSEKVPFSRDLRGVGFRRNSWEFTECGEYV